MSYDVLSDDLFDDDDVKKSSSKSSKSKKDKSKKKMSFKFKPMYIHIFLILLVILAILYLVFYGLPFDFSGGSDERKVVLVGQVHDFNESFNGNLTLYSSNFEITSSNGVFTDKSEDIFLEEFNGRIFYRNNTIVFEGMAQEVSYGSNTLNLNGGTFELVSKQKTNIDLVYDNLELYFLKGTGKLGKGMTHEFSNSSIVLHNFNMTMTYDGTFSFIGMADSFEIETKSLDLKIIYAKSSLIDDVEVEPPVVVENSTES